MANFDVIILAAGLGTRMKSDLPKVIHEVAGKPLIYHVLEAIKPLKPGKIIIVVGYQGNKVVNIVNEFGSSNILFANQKEQLGTAHAVSTGLKIYELIEDHPDFTLVLYGDVPLIKSKTLQRLVDTHDKEKPAVTILTTVVDDATGYGRIIRDSNNFVTNIVEEKEANEEQRKIKEINPGFYCFNFPFLLENIKKISNDNLKGEYYLTDMIPLTASLSKKIIGVEAQDPDEVMGINTIEELQHAENIFNNRIK